MEQDNKMIDAVIELLEKRVHVAIVTAAGYPNRPELFQRRIPGLLTAFQKRKLSKDVTDRFLLLGGECNYLLGYALPHAWLEI
jgi:IMP and pyridine-specific 5'-nucleotidase